MSYLDDVNPELLRKVRGLPPSLEQIAEEMNRELAETEKALEDAKKKQSLLRKVRLSSNHQLIRSIRLELKKSTGEEYGKKLQVFADDLGLTHEDLLELLKEDKRRSFREGIGLAAVAFVLGSILHR